MKAASFEPPLIRNAFFLNRDNVAFKEQRKTMLSVLQVLESVTLLDIPKMNMRAWQFARVTGC